LSDVKLKFLNEIMGLGGIRVAKEGANGRARLGRENENRAKSATYGTFWNFGIKFSDCNLGANGRKPVQTPNFRAKPGKSGRKSWVASRPSFFPAPRSEEVIE
jgi:hypothetical protein